MVNVRLGISAPHFDLLAVELHVSFLQSTHLLDLIEVDDKAFLQVVELPDAFSTKDAWVLRAVKVLNPLLMLLAHVREDVLVLRKVFHLKALVEVYIRK